jgi:hypothetical protein
MNTSQSFWFRQLAIFSAILLCISIVHLTNSSTENYHLLNSGNIIGCRLQIPDPWHPSILGLFDNNFQDHSLPILPSNMSVVTSFKDGILSKIHSAYSCQYRCYDFKSKASDEIQFGNWIQFQASYGLQCNH